MIITTCPRCNALLINMVLDSKYVNHCPTCPKVYNYYKIGCIDWLKVFNTNNSNHIFSYSIEISHYQIYCNLKYKYTEVYNYKNNRMTVFNCDYNNLVYKSNENILCWIENMLTFK